MTIQHKHLLLNATISRPMKAETEAIEFLRSLVERIDMKIIQGPFATYIDNPGNKGITAIVMIETSHIAFHIWDETDPAVLQFDLYTCGSLNADDVLDMLRRHFEIQHMDWHLYDRKTGFVIEAEGHE